MDSNAAAKQNIIRLVPLLDLPEPVQMLVRDIRNEEGVRRWMYTDHLITANEHMAWIQKLKGDAHQLVFAVLDSENGAPLGLASVNAIDPHHQRADWAYYLCEGARGGLGAAIEYAFLDFIFGELGIEKLNCEVIEGNDAVVKLHRKFLFEEEGLRRSNIVKNGARTGVHLLGLSKVQWMAGREMVYHRFCRVLDRFSVSILRPDSIKAGAS